MSKSFYIKLTFAVYRVTALIPAGQTLRYEIRQMADETLIGLIRNDSKAYLEGIRSLNALFDLVEKRGWVDPRNFQVLRREYAKITNTESDVVKAVPYLPEGKDNFLGGSKNRRRQEAILGVLKDNKKVKIKDLAKSFPGVNRRTLLRDLGLFCQSGLIERNGSGRGACYTIKNATLYREMSQLA